MFEAYYKRKETLNDTKVEIGPRSNLVLHVNQFGSLSKKANLY